MDQTSEISQRSQWRELLDRLTKEHQGAEVTIEIVDSDFGDGYEAERLPLAYFEYDPKDDVFIVAVGGRDGRYPIILRHFIEHPKSISVDRVGPEIPIALEIVSPEDSRTVISVRQGPPGRPNDPAL